MPSVIAIKLQSNVVELILRHGCSPANLMHILRIPFPKNNFGWLLLMFSAMFAWRDFKMRSHFELSGNLVMTLV